MDESVPVFKDKTITCIDCQQPFTFNAEEQGFFWSKGLSQPKRCKPCRAKRKATLIPHWRGKES